jgi:hypothetical protein
LNILLINGIIFLGIFAMLINFVYGENNETTSIEETLYFSIEIPNNWAYEEFSNSYGTELLGFGPINTISLSPAELYDQSVTNSTGVTAVFQKDDYYSLKNTSLETYVKYKMDQIPRDTMNITSSDIVDFDQSILKFLDIEDIIIKPIKLKDLIEKINTIKQKVIVKHS